MHTEHTHNSLRLHLAITCDLNKRSIAQPSPAIHSAHNRRAISNKTRCLWIKMHINNWKLNGIFVCWLYNSVCANIYPEFVKWKTRFLFALSRCALQLNIEYVNMYCKMILWTFVCMCERAYQFFMAFLFALCISISFAFTKWNMKRMQIYCCIKMRHVHQNKINIYMLCCKFSNVDKLTHIYLKCAFAELYLSGSRDNNVNS